MRASAPAARRVIAVSRRDSPLDTEELDALTLMTSALIHLPATSKDTRVRVEFSKNTVMTVRPRSVGSLRDLAAQQRLLEAFCLVEKFYRGLTIEVRDGKQVLHALLPPEMTTASLPSCSGRSTLTSS